VKDCSVVEENPVVDEYAHAETVRLQRENRWIIKVALSMKNATRVAMKPEEGAVAGWRGHSRTGDMHHGCN
jgi:hypothetical protein